MKRLHRKNFIKPQFLEELNAKPITPRTKYRQALALMSPKTVSLWDSDAVAKPAYYSWSSRHQLYAVLHSMGWHWQKSGEFGYWSDAAYWSAQIPF